MPPDPSLSVEWNLRAAGKLPAFSVDAVGSTTGKPVMQVLLLKKEVHALPWPSDQLIKPRPP